MRMGPFRVWRIPHQPCPFSLIPRGSSHLSHWVLPSTPGETSWKQGFRFVFFPTVPKVGSRRPAQLQPIGDYFQSVSSSPRKVRTSGRQTDPLARQIFNVLESESTEDKKLFLQAMEAHAGGASTERMAIVRSAIERYEAETLRTLSKRQYESWRVATDDPSIPSATFIASTFGGSWSKAMSGLGREPAMEHAAYRLRALGRAPTNDEALAAIAQSAAETGAEPFRFHDYRSWAVAKQRSLPENKILLISPSSFIQRFGSFGRACALAGVSLPNQRGPRGSRDASSEEAIVNALLWAASECSGGKPITLGAYSLWRRRKHEDAELEGEWMTLPSAPSIRNRFGSWPAALEASGLLSHRKAKNFARGRGRKMSVEQIADGLLRASRVMGPRFSIEQYRVWRTRQGDEPFDSRAASVNVVRRHLKSWVEIGRLLEIADQDENPLGRLVEEIQGLERRA